MNPRPWIVVAVTALAGAACSSAEQTQSTSENVVAEAAAGRDVPAREAASSAEITATVATARANLEAGLGAAALAALNQLVHDHPDSAPAWLALAQAHHDPDLPVELRDTETSVRAARQAIACVAGSPGATYLITLGTALYLSGDLEEAIDAYELALRDSAEDRAELQQLVLSLRLR